MTGSHNMGTKASEKNDDNLIIIENNGPLAQAYAVNIIAIYQNYQWRLYRNTAHAANEVWSHLEDSDAWQNGHLQGWRGAELDFWLGEEPTAQTPAPTPTARQEAAPKQTAPKRKTKAKSAGRRLRSPPSGRGSGILRRIG